MLLFGKISSMAGNLKVVEYNVALVFVSGSIR